MKKFEEIQEILESDDELPMNYHEDPDTPAYQKEYRFDKIQFKWINNPTLQSPKNEIDIPSQNNVSFLKHDEPLVKKGVLNSCDLFCIKSIEGHTGDSTFIWLINFLLYKDIQANYMFLKSCLVDKLHSSKYMRI